MNKFLATTDDNYLIDFQTLENPIFCPYAVELGNNPNAQFDNPLGIKGLSGNRVGAPHILRFLLSQTSEPIGSPLYSAVNDLLELYPANAFLAEWVWFAASNSYVNSRGLSIKLPQVINEKIDSSSSKIDLGIYQNYFTNVEKINSAAKQVFRFEKKLNIFNSSICAIIKDIEKKYPKFSFLFPVSPKKETINFKYLSRLFLINKDQRDELDYWLHTLKDTSDIKRRLISVNALQDSLESLYTAPQIEKEGFLICEASASSIEVLCVGDDGDYYLSNNPKDAVGVFASQSGAVALTGKMYDKNPALLYVAHYKNTKLVALSYCGKNKNSNKDIAAFDADLQSRFEKIAIENCVLAQDSTKPNSQGAAKFKSKI